MYDERNKICRTPNTVHSSFEPEAETPPVAWIDEASPSSPVTPFDTYITMTPEAVEDTLAPLRWSILVANPQVPVKTEPFVIDRPVVVSSNPIAGGGKAIRYAGKLHDTFALQADEGHVVFMGDVEFIETKKNPGARIRALAEAMRKTDTPPYAIACGGDGSFVDSSTAAYTLAKEGWHVRPIPYMGGTAGDMRRELGVPPQAKHMSRFLTTAVPVELDVVTARFNGGEPQLVLHSQGNGVSGEVFLAAESRRTATGKISIPTYLRGMVGGVWKAKTFYVRVDGGKPIAVGEVITLANSTSIGGVTYVPLPERGGQILLVPVNPKLPGPLRLTPGLGPFFDAFRRGIRYALGDQTVIAPGSKLALLDDTRMIPVMPGTKHTLEFVDANGQPKPVTSVINGDPIQNVQKVVIEGTGETIRTLATKDSAIMVRRGLASPTTILGTAASKVRTMGATTMRGATRAAPLSLIVIHEVIRDLAGFHTETQTQIDTMHFGGLMTGSIFVAARYGSMPFIVQMARISPFPIVGDAVGRGISNAVGNELGIDALTDGHDANKWVGFSSGLAALIAGDKLLGAELAKAIDKSVMDFLVRTIGGAGAKVEGWLASAVRLLRGMPAPMLMLIIIDQGVIDCYMTPSSDEDMNAPLGCVGHRQVL